MSHPLLKKMHLDSNAEGRRYATQVGAWDSENDPDSATCLRAALELLDLIAPPTVTKVVSLRNVEDLEATAVLISLAGRRLPEVMAWCVISTYDPNGRFCPGKQVVWEGRHSQTEADAALPLWQARQGSRTDIHEVKFTACPLSHLRRPGMPGGPS